MGPHYIGNDIVDLDDPTIAEHHERPRLIERVCAPSERNLLKHAEDPKAFFWSLFAAKEAAFKLALKRFGSMPFAHQAFVVSADLRTVRYGSTFLPLKVEVGMGWVHALVCSSLLGRSRVDLRAEGSESERARAVLLELGSRMLGLPLPALSVVRRADPERWDGLAEPRLLFRGEPTQTDVSLSHDGRFVAAALVPQAAPQPGGADGGNPAR